MSAVINKMDEPTRKRRVARDIWTIRQALKELGLHTELQRLERPSPMRSFAMVAISWLLILASSYSVSELSVYFLPLALIVVASRQRALNNSIHEACHQARRSEAAKLMLALPMLESFSEYRSRHLQHHAKLGIFGLDPDLVVVDKLHCDSPVKAYWQKFTDGHFFIENAFGCLPLMSRRERFLATVFWASLVSSWGLWRGPRAAAVLIGIWLLSRATVYHAIKSFTELADHFGLTPGGIMGFTRNSYSPLLGFLVHPHNDNYHLTHHLAPKVPLANLARVHELMLRVPEYVAGIHCDSYFWGSNSVVRSWMSSYHRACASASVASDAGGEFAGLLPAIGAQRPISDTLQLATMPTKSRQS
jgi:fatty acid desaturase